MSTRDYEAKRVIKGSVDMLEFNDFTLNEVVSVKFSACENTAELSEGSWKKLASLRDNTSKH